MTIQQRIQKDFVIAFKAGETAKKDTLGMLKTRITELEKKNGTDVTDADVTSVVQTYIKQLNQTLDSIKGQNPVLEQSTQDEIALVSAYLPKQMSEEEITVAIQEYLGSENNNNTKSALGGIMKFFKERYNGQYDSKLVKELTDKALAGIV